VTDDRSRWPRVKEIFHSALECAPDRRAAFLHDACGEDLALRDDVESLLAAHADAGSFAERAAIDDLASHDSVMINSGVPALAAGLELGPYRILGPLDAGGMGEVFRALDTRLHREVAVKVLPAAVSRDPERVARMQREARLLAALNHPNIATVHGLETAGGLLAIVMELIDGPTLADRLASGPLPLDAALELARQIAEALEAAHDKGIVHRDLKPANIKLAAGGMVKVLDFGLAKAMAPEPGDIATAAASSGAVSRDGAVMGTPAYMSPEQARGERVDARSDVWAFGCVLYEMLTARSPFGRASTAETLAAILEREPDWDRLPPAVPVSIRRVLRRCLARDPRRRLHHIADARIEIEDAASEPDARASALLAESGRRRQRVLAISASVLALGCAAALVVWFLRPPAEVPELRVVEITTPWTSDPWSFAVSPDGRRIAFVADHEGQPTLWVRALDAAGAHALPGTDGARRPFWSPDSRSIGFFANSVLKRIEARGGSAQTVAYALGGTTAAWGSDGTILFSSTAAPFLRRVNAAGGAVDTATKPAAESTGHRHPQFLPGGRQFLFFVGGPDAVRGVYLGSLGSSEAARVVASDTQGAYVLPGWLLFIRQGTLWAQRFDLARQKISGEPITVADSVAFEPIDGTGAFSTSNAGVIAYRAGRPSVTRLSWFDRSGNTLATLGSPEQAGLSNLRLSPDGRRVAAERTLQNETDLWLLDATRQTRFTHGTDGTIARLPVWSPDGARVAFESVRSGSVALSMKPSTGDGAGEVLFESPEVKIPCDWSPDGRFLLYYVPDPKTGTDLWVLPSESRVPFVFLKTDANELWGQFSPDGRWVAYQSNETGRYEIYVRPFSGPGGAAPVSTAGGVYPRWSHDGRELYFIAPDAKMMSASIRANATAVDSGAPTPLFQTRRLGGGLNVIGRSHQYDVARDGRFLINVDAESSAPPITLLMNWKP
jgi:serine/threonine protein kinase/Tol biopolymer transport system component